MVRNILMGLSQIATILFTLYVYIFVAYSVTMYNFDMLGEPKALWPYSLGSIIACWLGSLLCLAVINLFAKSKLTRKQLILISAGSSLAYSVSMVVLFRGLVF